MMNRRNFLAGLLATTAAVPLAKALPLPVEPVVAWDFASGPDTPAIFISNAMMEATWFTRLYLSPVMFDYLAGTGEFERQFASGYFQRVAMILDAAPVPEEDRYIMNRCTPDHCQRSDGIICADGECDILDGLMPLAL